MSACQTNWKEKEKQKVKKTEGNHKPGQSHRRRDEE